MSEHSNRTRRHLRNYGAHLQVKLFTPRKETLWNAFLQWGGVAVTTGFDHARMRLSLEAFFALVRLNRWRRRRHGRPIESRLEW